MVTKKDHDLYSDYAEDDVKPRNRADAACSQGTGLTFSA